MVTREEAIARASRDWDAHPLLVPIWAGNELGRYYADPRGGVAIKHFDVAQAGGIPFETWTAERVQGYILTTALFWASTRNVQTDTPASQASFYIYQLCLPADLAGQLWDALYTALEAQS